MTSTAALAWSTLEAMVGEDSDEALMLRYQAGDAGAFDQLYARHKGPLYRYLMRQCKQRERVDEVFQDTWMNLINARARYRPGVAGAKFSTYLFTLAHNRLVDLVRSDARAAFVPLESGNDEEADVQDRLPAGRTVEPEVQASSREQATAILKALDSLPDAQREAFLLYEESGLGIAEIAEVTGVSFEAAKSRLRYALAKLRDQLQAYA